jgi:hypothetical protein
MLFGKLDFVNQAPFGRVGRVGMLPIKKRQHSDSESGVGFELKAALVRMIQILLAVKYSSHAEALVKPRQKRIINTFQEIISLIRSGKLTSSSTAKSLGKLDLVNQIPFGLVGRACMYL